jgi:hypothetical protein
MYTDNDGTKIWWLNGVRHREDGPAIEWTNGYKGWWHNAAEYTKQDYYRVAMNKNNKPICEVNKNGTKIWWLNGKLHREDGPSIEYTDGCKLWHLNGKLHREDGPAVEWVDGAEYWYLNDKRYTKQNYYRELVKRGLCIEEDAFIELL